MTEEKPHRYYGLQYTWSVGVMAKLANVSLRTMKDGLKLHSMGYDEKIAEGWSAAQCFAHAGQERKRRATPKVDDLDDAVYEIKRLRELLQDLGVDPALSPKRILFQHTFQLPKRGGKEQKAAPRANNNTEKKRLSDGKPKEEKLTRETSQPDRLDRTPVHVQQTSQPLPESGTETTTLTSRQEYERLRRQRPKRRETARKVARERRQRAKELGLCRDDSNKAIPGQTRCETCAEKQRQARRRDEEPRGERKPPRTD